MVDDLFIDRWQRVILWLANSWLGKLYLTSGWNRTTKRMAWRWMAAPRFDRITTSSFTFLSGFDRSGRAIYTSRFYTDNHFAKKIATLLFWLPYEQAVPIDISRDRIAWRPAFAWSLIALIAALMGVPAMAATTSTFNSATGSTSPVDGVIGLDGSAVWSTTRNNTGSLATAATSNSVQSAGWFIIGGAFALNRLYLLFNTGPTIPLSATIVSATLTVQSGSTITDTANDGNSYIAVIQTRPAADNTLATGDIDEITPVPVTAAQAMTEGSNQLDITGISTESSNVFTLTATGLSWIARATETLPGGAPSSGITRLGLAEGHDINDAAPSSPAESDGERVFFYLADNGATIPQLSVTWTPEYRQQITFSQHRLFAPNFTNAASTTIAFSGAVSTSDLLTAVLDLGSSGATVSTITDNVNPSTAWKRARSQAFAAGSSGLLELWYAQNSLSGTPTVTVTMSATAAGTMQCGIAAWGNADTTANAFAQGNSTVGNSSLLGSGGGLSSVSSGSLIIASWRVTSNYTNRTDPSGYSTLAPNQQTRGNSYYKLMGASTGTEDPKWQITAAQNAAGLVAEFLGSTEVIVSGGSVYYFLSMGVQ